MRLFAPFSWIAAVRDRDSVVQAGKPCRSWKAFAELMELVSQVIKSRGTVPGRNTEGQGGQRNSFSVTHMSGGEVPNQCGRKRLEQDGCSCNSFQPPEQ